MKHIKWLRHLGEGVCEIVCEKCGRPFYHDVLCKHNNSMVVCPGCGNVWPEKDVDGLIAGEESRKIIPEQNPDTGERTE